MMTNLSPASVLAILSDGLARDLVSLALRRAGYTPVICAEPGDARSLVAEHSPAVLLVDLHLNGASGLHLINELKQDGLLAGRAVIVISALSFPEVIQQAVRAGANDFLVKPLNMDVLISRVGREIEKLTGF